MNSSKIKKKQNKSVFRFILITCFLSFLSACGADYDGYGQMGADKFNGPGNEFLFINEQGRDAYQSQCTACHGSSGEGSPSGPSLVACSSCTDVTTLKQRIKDTMPTGNIASCGEDCAFNTAEYIMGAFNGILLLNSTAALTGVDVLDYVATLRKATLNLVGRLPSDSELSLVKNSGEAGLDGVLDKVMEEEVFYERLKEIYNDTLLQDKYLGSENALGLLRSDEYPARRWYRDLGLDTDSAGDERDLYYRLRAYSNDAVGREVLELVDYVVRNDLPFTEILTADYTMVNAYSARVYGVEGQASFRDMQDIEYPAYPEDPKDFQPARIAGIPHAGVLTSVMFLNRFPTTATNKNRHRSRMVYSLFLDTDILAISGSRPGESLDETSVAPELNNPQCTACHEVMDPVASTFQNWDGIGRYRPSSEYNNWYTDILARGFSGMVMPLSGNSNSSLQWLGEKIAADPRFAMATVKTIYKGLSGQSPLFEPAEKDFKSAQWQAYLAQQVTFKEIAAKFTAADSNLKLVIKEVIKTIYWRAKGLQSGADAAIHAKTGAARLLTPEMLDRKIIAVTGEAWNYSTGGRFNYLTENRSDSYRQLYGGIDSNNIVKRITDPNGLIVAVQNRMAAEMACKVVSRDFFKPQAQRFLFPYISLEALPSESHAVKENIRHLHWVFFGEQLSLDSVEVSEVHSLFNSVMNDGLSLIDTDNTWTNQRLRWPCLLRNHPETGDVLAEEDRIEVDTSYSLRAWQSVLNYMLSDYKFLYE